MASSGMLRRMALVRTDVSEDLSVGTTLALFLVHRSSETSVLTRTTRRNIAEDAILLANAHSPSCVVALKH
jgi:hypothetical protein